MTTRSPLSTRFLLDRFHVELGTLLVVTDEIGHLRALDFDDAEARLHRLLGLHYGPTVTVDEGPMPSAVREALVSYFAGALDALEAIPVATGGTAFQRDVWQALRGIPAGETRSYGALASAIGRPLAVRAVGAANGANPIGIVVPCHRVIGKSGALTGYAGGIDRKRWLLAHEMRSARAQTPGGSSRRPEDARAEDASVRLA